MSLTSMLLWIFLLPFESLAQVRLSGGSETAGRVEVFLNGEWGTVCDDDWDVMDATVVCRQLGFPAVLDALASFGEGQGPIHLDEVSCIGDESSLLACPQINYFHDCSHSEDVGISCLPVTFYCYLPLVRLSGGSKAAGRVEVFLHGEWGTVCDDDWDVMDATVVCRQLGFPAVSVLDALASFGEGQGPIYFDEVSCFGDESSLLACPRDYYFHDCSHGEDVGISCLPGNQKVITDFLLSFPIVRLSGGSETAGRVEVFLNGEWGTVCDDDWDVMDATVVCRQLGFPAVLDALASFGEGQGPIHLDEVSCFGDESSLLACPRINYFHDCSHSEDVGISCLVPGKYVFPRSIQVKSQGYSRETAGRVDVFLHGEWGTVCDDNWDIMDATVVCRQLGFPAALVLDALASFGEGQGPIYLDEVACVGDESSFLVCPRDYYFHDCSHSEDVGISCLPGKYVFPRIRLTGGNSTTGRVEVFLNNQWGTVCDDYWDIVAAGVICRQLGFKTANLAFSYGGSVEDTIPINVDDVVCTGSEISILDCYFISEHNCDHREDAGVNCLPYDAC
ncbi:Deleted in malignant brain tumors 1 protein [Holothuria leucospilota]|uniref:Deleted in malignant brain tumors 1 protein n=1 Tax=Holothuria leucospilota TaxID=206669 RepID=A0A9Q0YQ45_HOLLE|nr:Deleted in malignant brain tumors 1 protein [Holothuria leucospilota]